MPGDVGAVATLLNTLASWFLNPNGYATLSREDKLAKLHDGLKTALDAGAYDAADLVFAELRRLSQTTGS
jgi:hypothetical protein